MGTIEAKYLKKEYLMEYIENIEEEDIEREPKIFKNLKEILILNIKQLTLEKIPIMTSQCENGYMTSASTTWDENHLSFYAFDGNTKTRWASKGLGEQWIQIELPKPAIYNVVRIASRGDGCLDQSPKDFSIQGSLNKSDWVTLITLSGIQWNELGQIQSFHFPKNETAFRYYRLFITANNGSSAAYAISILSFERE